MADLLIRQLDVFSNPAARRGSDTFTMALPSDHISDTRGVLVAPLARVGDRDLDPKLYAVVQVGRGSFAVVVTEMAAVPRKLLTAPVANLGTERDRTVRALDLIFTGV